MITAITGLHGTGKTWLMVNQFLYPAWKAGSNIMAYNELLFSEDGERVDRFWQLSDLYNAQDCLVGFPELQKLLNSESWRSMPGPFRDLLSEHRHSKINIVGDTQDLMLIDIGFRRHIAEVYHCRTVLRFPANERALPIIQWISVQKKVRKFDKEGTHVLFKKEGRPKNYFISKLWSKKLYNTYEKLKTSRYAIWLTTAKKKTTCHVMNRELRAPRALNG
jgi:hypothetical protein